MTENFPLSADQQTLLTVYRQLSEDQQIIVQLFSVTFFGCNRTVLGLCLQKLGIKSPKGKTLTSKGLEPYLETPLRSGLLIEFTSPYKGRLGCHPLFVEIATRIAVQEQRFDAMAAAVIKFLNIPAPTQRNIYEIEKALCGARIYFYRQDFNPIHEYFKSIRPWARHPNIPDELGFYSRLIGNPYDAEWYAKMPQDLRGAVPAYALRQALIALQPPDVSLALLKGHCQKSGYPIDDNGCVALIEMLLTRGEWDEAGRYLSGPHSPELMAALAWLQFLRGENERALETYHNAFTLLRQKSGKRVVYFEQLPGLFWPIALIKSGQPDHLQLAEDCLEFAQTNEERRYHELYSLLRQFLKVLRGDLHEPERIMAAPIDDSGRPLIGLFTAVIQHWTLADAKRIDVDRLAALHERAQNNGYRWLAAESANILLSALGREDAGRLRQEVETFFGSSRHSLLEVFKPRRRWEMALDALAALNPTPAGTGKGMKAVAKTSRLVWWLTFHQGKLSIEPKEQILNPKGDWTKGRAVALKRLKEASSASLGFLTPQDRAVCAHIHKVYEGGVGNAYLVFKPQAILALAGHPLLFWADHPDIHVELVLAGPELHVEKRVGGGFKLRLSPEPEKDQSKIRIIRDTPTRLKVVEFKPEHRKIHDILGKQALEVPASADEKVRQAIAGIAPFLTVVSDLGGKLENIEQVAADGSLRVHLLPYREGLKVAFLIRPFGDTGAYYAPGEGGATVIAEVGGRTVQTLRDLTRERMLVRQAFEVCSTLAHAGKDEGEFVLEDLEQCLEFLLELDAIKLQVQVEWPEGEKFRLTGQAGSRQFQVSIHKNRDWFELDGKLQVNEQQVYEMGQLLDWLESHRGRFMKLEDGQFLALTDEFRRRLEDLRAYCERRGKHLRIHPLAAPAFDGMESEIAEFVVDEHWQEHLKRLRAAQHLQPQLPSGFRAELREYQREGFEWLMRLANWGVGGCLADDMGLGKTLQALAAIVSLAPHGPTLVVAPTSVCMNWEDEAARFAPVLKVKHLGTSDRQRLLDNLQPFDLLLCSYGLLQQESVAKALAGVAFQTIVLDEAQAIKNIATRRSQAAMKLQADFKLITSGTPLENHLGELWNLFRFINPGLLGSLDRFNRCFAGPIERIHDERARQRLRKLIRPFILRRTKAQVLQELPPRTEIVVHVDLSDAETAFYQALRREAVQTIARMDTTGGQKHLQILAEIMKLRRACCDTRLVAPELALPSSKLEAFGDIVDELLDNGHKALVFSQFVDHLQLLKNFLDTKGVSYQYLDGGTSGKDRKQRVEAFQRGEGELFLISLKAGGVGLNLTAADFVVHMDPWWNPAVEDQASDRSYRIGQQRPVTVYRLVTRHTIEEKIVALHAHKRDLARSLLEGADISGKMSAEELLALMSEA